MRKIITVSVFWMFLAVRVSPGQEAAGPRQLLDAALTAIGSEDGWQSDVVGSKLKAIVVSFPSSPEFLTARALLVSQLMETGKYIDALALANAALTAAPVSWRNAWVASDKAAILGFQERDAESLKAAKNALLVISDAALTDVSDPDFLRLLRVTNAKRTDLKDGVLSMIAAQLIKQGALVEADYYIAQIVDAKSREHIQLYRQQKLQ